jgi:hypothetical protein
MGNNQPKQIANIINEVVQATMTNIANNNSFNLNTLVENVQDNTINIGDAKIVGCTFKQTNNLNSDTKIVAKISSKSLSDVSNIIQSEVQTKLKQNLKIVNEFLSGIGTNNSPETIANLTNRVSQIIQTNIENTNIAEIFAQTINKQGNTFNFGKGEIICTPQNPVAVEQINNIQTRLATDIVFKNVNESIVKDEVINRIINDVTQEAEIINKGPSALFLLIILGIIFFLVYTFTYVVTRTANAFFKYFLVIVLLVLIWLALAYYFKRWPFQVKTPEYWSCIKDLNGLVTNECRRVESREQGPFGSESQCKEAISKGNAPCGQYWGCGKTEGAYGKIYTGACIQYNNASDGPYKTKNECDKANTGSGAICRNNFICPIDNNGLFLEPAICVPVIPSYTSIDKIKDENTCKGDMYLKCRNYWGISKDEKGNYACVAYRDNNAVKIAQNSADDVTFYPEVITFQDCENKKATLQ